MKTYIGLINKLEPHQIFCYGSNRQGIPGAGAALVARKLFGARNGASPVGLIGQSYGIATKDLNATEHPSVSPGEIIGQIKDLYLFAKRNPAMEFFVAYDDKGPYLSGFTAKELASMFKAAGMPPDNIIFETGFRALVDA